MVMHPGPINRGIEITSDVADSKQSLILQQVENGVAVRMAVLYLWLVLSNKTLINVFLFFIKQFYSFAHYIKI